MKTAVCFGLMLMLSCPLYAGNHKEDSLLKELKAQGGDVRLQAALYGELCFATRGSDVQRSIGYGRKAIDLAGARRYNDELATAFVYMGFAYEAAGFIDKGFDVADSATKLFTKSTDYHTIYYHEALLGSLNRRKAVYDEALKHYLASLKIAEDHSDQFLLARAYNGLGTFSSTINSLDKAEDYHLKALAIRLKLGNPKDIFQSYDNLGIIQRSRGNYDMALRYYFKAVEQAMIASDSSSLSFIYNDIGAAYSFKGNLLQADRFLKASIAIREKMDELHELAYTYNYLGENDERRHDYASAERHIKKALAIAQQIGNHKQTAEAYESLSDFYARNRIYDSAYHYALVFKNYRDSITRINQAEIIEELNTKYETAKKEHQITEQQLQITRRNYLIGGILCLLLTAAALVWSYFRRSKLKQEGQLQSAILRQQELATKAILEAEENERKRIAGDLHDGVGQMMSAAKINLSTLTNEIPFTSQDQRDAFDKALTLVDESCREVRAVSHNIMPNALLRSGLALAVRDFINKIDHRVIAVNLYTEGLNDRIDGNIEIVLYRVIQECVNNVIKHSGAAQLDLTLIRDEDGISITIEDNGKGFSLHDDTKKDGIGLKNIQTRIDYLKGTVEWDSAIGKGTVVTVHIPV
jgi:two-component system NarL family sensor kinase